jgi:thioredoxin 1
MVTAVENNNLNEAKNSDMAVIDFSAEWCGPCCMLAPIMEELSDELDGKVDFYNVNVDANPALAMEYGINSIPAIILMKKGKVVKQTVGYQPKETMKNFILS